MNDWQDEFEVVCSSRELSECERECRDECAARAAMIQEREDQEGAE